MCIRELVSLTKSLLVPGVALMIGGAGDLTSPLQASPPAETWPISCFVYRDVNRNGIYDWGDSPYAGLPVEITRPDGSVVRKQSNIAGFANFQAKYNDPEKGDFYAVGEYPVHAVLPWDWTSMSPNAVDQVAAFRRQENAGGGIVPAKPCANIGVMPKLKVSGTITSGAGAQMEDLTVRAQKAGGKTFPVAVNESGQFIFPADAGEWNVTISNARTKKRVTRTVTVREYAVLLSSVNLDAPERAPLTNAELVTVSFDDLTTSDTLREVPSNYHGLNWSYWVGTHNKFYEGYGYVNATTSGEFIAYNSSGIPATFSSSAPFDFAGTHVAAAWPRGEEESVTVKAWRNETLAYTDVFSISTAGPFYFAADYRSVTRVEFSHGNYERIAIDDLTIRK